MSGFVNREELTNAILKRMEQYGYEKEMSPEKHHSYQALRKVINIRLFGIIKNSKELPKETLDKALNILNEILPELFWEEEIKKVRCDMCSNRKLDIINGMHTLVSTCELNKHDLTKEDLNTFEIECDAFKSKYIEYPITVSSIEVPKDKGLKESRGYKKGTLVKVRPCDEKYNNKTYLGFLLGDIDMQLFISHNSENKELRIYRNYNPAIFVPELKEVIYGCGSWWGEIKSEEDLKDITDNDIENVWYVKAWKKLNDDKLE